MRRSAVENFGVNSDTSADEVQPSCLLEEVVVLGRLEVGAVDVSAHG